MTGKWISGNLLSITKDGRNLAFSHLIIRIFLVGLLIPVSGYTVIYIHFRYAHLHISLSLLVFFLLVTARTDSIGALLFNDRNVRPT